MWEGMVWEGMCVTKEWFIQQRMVWEELMV